MRCCDECTVRTQFQSTRPRGARLACGDPPNAPRSCFNPRAREGRDYVTTTALATMLAFQSTRP